MRRMSNRVSEDEVGAAVLRIAAQQPDGIATFDKIREEAPDLLNLSDEDLRVSTTRPNEGMWEQQIRNIKSHDQSPGNIICEGLAEHVPNVGYKITARGRRSIIATAA